MRGTPARGGQRGEILGAGGSLIVTDRPLLRTGIDKTRLTSAEQAPTSARALAALVDVDADAYVARVRAAGPKAFVEALVLRADQAVPAAQPRAPPPAPPRPTLRPPRRRRGALRRHPTADARLDHRDPG